MDPGGRILELRAAMVPGEECVVPLEGVSRRFGHARGCYTPRKEVSPCPYRSDRSPSTDSTSHSGS
jgi:hypothetical protein